jgi:hypothetical protein
MNSPQQRKIVEEVTQRLANLTGAPTEWLHQHLKEGETRAADIATNAVSWALCVEYVVDLVRRPIQAELKVIESLSDAVRNECCRLARDLRQHRPEFYRSTALDTQDRLRDERKSPAAEDLGQIDTFPFEEEVILRASIDALGRRQWQKAIDWAEQRSDEQSFWQRDDPSRSDAWKLVLQAAALGQAIAQAGPSLGDVGSLESALARYVELGSRVDLAIATLRCEDVLS